MSVNKPMYFHDLQYNMYMFYMQLSYGHFFHTNPLEDCELITFRHISTVTPINSCCVSE